MSIDSGTVDRSYTYNLPEPTDEEILSFYKAEGVTDVNPEDVRNYIRKCLHQAYCEAVSKRKECETRFESET